MFKKLICLFFVLFAFCVPFSVLAESGISASLSDVITDKNRLFETTLSINAEVAAFVATLEFDESKVEFRSAKALSEDSVLSVNNSEKGKVTLAFVNKYGTEGEIISFTFKANSENAFISLSLEQIIDKSAENIELNNTKGADVTITAKSANKTDTANKSAESKKETTAFTSESKDYLSLNVPEKENHNLWLIVCISMGGFLIIAVGIIGFVLGRSSGSKK